jgi:hypothetical protein
MLNGTQAISQINSKYIRELRDSRESRPVLTKSHIQNENAYNDFILKNQAISPADNELPFSVVNASLRES